MICDDGILWFPEFARDDTRWTLKKGALARPRFNSKLPLVPPRTKKILLSVIFSIEKNVSSQQSISLLHRDYEKM
jgi:hypothetical protein